MFRSFVAGALMALGLAGTAAAEPFDDFVAMCLRADGNAEAAAAGATAAGWTKLPMQAFEAGEFPFDHPSVFTSLEVTDFEMKDIPADLRFLMTGGGAAGFGISDTRFEMCAIGAASSDAAEARTLLEAHFGFPPTAFDGDEVWAYSRQGARYVPEADILDQDDPAEALRGKKVYVAGVIDSGGLIILIMSALRSTR